MTGGDDALAGLGRRVDGHRRGPVDVFDDHPAPGRAAAAMDRSHLGRFGEMLKEQPGVHEVEPALGQRLGPHVHGAYGDRTAGQQFQEAGVGVDRQRLALGPDRSASIRTTLPLPAPRSTQRQPVPTPSRSQISAVPTL
ncbi:hypothetical protein ABZ826_36670 [Streptomyces sp. NPDC047515]|uniref:hypothetical protein n=1 Tax=Streptomyces sp. NPDC047515 TaxID=3155380 RepID=UPI0033C1554C